ncbi:MAG: beta-glucosidase [Cyanobacteria bacterium CRU_2_1]|nr:beta-glucosidase [Cyanobacteria bacterium RU_5_0]NJR62143.1 beta-glucosidase [Cyanobacteria bacterium CRU_2_1]
MKTTRSVQKRMSLPDWERLPLAKQIAQMIVVRASGYLFDHQIQYPQWEPPADILRDRIQELGVGGVILLGGSAAEVGVRSRQLQDWASIPLLIAADIEEGVGQRFAGATWFPPPMAIAALPNQSDFLPTDAARQMGAITAQEALAIGINWLLAPVVDVNNNPQNPVINVRSFGETAAIVCELAIAFLQGAQQHPILTTAKHFPGHGDTATDSHLDLPILPHPLDRLTEVEFPPFQAAIANNVDAVMTAHLQIPALDTEYPATLSHRILTGELRQRLGFEGLIVTDALIMGAIANRYGADEAAVMAIDAGVDILLMPPDPEGAIHAICQAIETGRITIDRIQASLERIWRSKRNVCFPAVADNPHAWETVPPPIRLEHLAQPNAIATATHILHGSQKIHRPTQNRIDRTRRSLSLRNLILLDSVIGSGFLTLNTPAITLPQQWGYHLQIIDRYTPPISLDATTDTHPTLLQLFIRGNPFRGSADLTQIAQDWFTFLLETDRLQALVIYGSPYVLDPFLPQLPPDIPYVFTYGQMAAAQAIALETLFSETTQPIQLNQIFTD